MKAMYTVQMMQGEIFNNSDNVFQGKFNFPSDVEVSNNARDLMQR